MQLFFFPSVNVVWGKKSEASVQQVAFTHKKIEYKMLQKAEINT